jgi:hypothetical protein
MRKHFWLLALTSFLCSAGLAGGQVSPGTPNFSAFDSHEVDTIDLLNNNIILNVPVRAKAGAIPFDLHLKANSYMSGFGSWLPTMEYTGGTSPFAPAANGILGPGTLAGSSVSMSSTCNGAATTKYMNWYVQTAGGTIHWLPTTDYTTSTSGGNCQPTFTDATIDGSGFTLTASGSTVVSVYEKNGTSIIDTELKDSNGNFITWNGDGWTDTLGLIAVSTTTSAPYSWTVGGNDETLTESTSSLTLETAFGCASIKDLSPTAYTMPVGHSFPDGTSLAYTYEGTPGHSGNYTGRIEQITLREGGTITYSYLGGNEGINCTYQSVPELKRVTSDGTTTYTLTYSQISGSNYKAANTVVDNGGNKTVYTFTGFTSTGTSATYAQVLTEVQRYLGASTLLTTDVYCYNTAFSSCSTSSAPGAQVTIPVSKQIVFHQIAVSYRNPF